MNKGRVLGEVGYIDTTETHVEDLELALELAESMDTPCPAHTKVRVVFRTRGSVKGGLGLSTKPVETVCTRLIDKVFAHRS